MGLVVGAVAVAVVLAAASIVRGGTNTFDFSVTAVPPQVTVTSAASGSGLAFAKFTPDTSSGAATHTKITLTFASGLTPTTVSSACATTSQTVTCNLGTVNPGQTVKVFVRFTVAQGTLAGAISSAVTGDLAFDVSQTANGGGQVSPQEKIAPLTIVNGTQTDGTCQAHDPNHPTTIVQTAPLSTIVSQSTALQFGDAAAALGLPCAWGVAGIDTNIPPGLQTQVSFVSGPQFAGLSTLTIAFNGLPVPLAKFVLKEDQLYRQPGAGNFQPVPPCGTPLPTSFPAGQDSCLIGFTKSGKVVFANLLFSGTGGDPGYAG